MKCIKCDHCGKIIAKNYRACIKIATYAPTGYGPVEKQSATLDPCIDCAGRYSDVVSKMKSERE